MTMKLIHWSNLVASPRNVRKHKTGIESLAATLATDGLLHNLVTTERADGKSPVIAGERRRRAIIQLVRAGTWPRDTHIPCEVREEEDATAVSYAENAQRVAMHPADCIRDSYRLKQSAGHRYRTRRGGAKPGHRDNRPRYRRGHRTLIRQAANDIERAPIGGLSISSSPHHH